ncbi:hypothetical protein ACOTTU_13580 [Roseobacter sp. EG26]|uniref:hypothetical protein n=1 Tax=Roseobacter sp. EG26 TaxID=3412477 RepID=UPI003CE480BE
MKRFIFYPYGCISHEKMIEMAIKILIYILFLHTDQLRSGQAAHRKVSEMNSGPPPAVTPIFKRPLRFPPSATFAKKTCVHHARSLKTAPKFAAATDATGLPDLAAPYALHRFPNQ